MNVIRKYLGYLWNMWKPTPPDKPATGGQNVEALLREQRLRNVRRRIAQRREGIEKLTARIDALRKAKKRHSHLVEQRQQYRNEILEMERAGV